MRFGTAALASRSLNLAQAEELGILIAEIILNKIDDQKATEKVNALVKSLTWWY